MREVALRPLAREDLRGVWSYTFKHWGEEQADRYLRRLNERIAELANGTERGKNLGAIRKGYHSIRVGRHLVVYTYTDQMVGIERVLHDQMDVGRHL